MQSEHKQLTLFNVVEKIENSTTTITELRIPIFSPVQKLSGNSVTAREFKKMVVLEPLRQVGGR